MAEQGERQSRSAASKYKRAAPADDGEAPDGPQPRSQPPSQPQVEHFRVARRPIKRVKTQDNPDPVAGTAVGIKDLKKTLNLALRQVTGFTETIAGVLDDNKRMRERIAALEAARHGEADYAKKRETLEALLKEASHVLAAPPPDHPSPPTVRRPPTPRPAPDPSSSSSSSSNGVSEEC